MKTCFRFEKCVNRIGSASVKRDSRAWRWIVGGKLWVLANKFGLITAWQVKTANVSDTEFLPLVKAVDGQMIV